MAVIRMAPSSFDVFVTSVDGLRPTVRNDNIWVAPGPHILAVAFRDQEFMSNTVAAGHLAVEFVAAAGHIYFLVSERGKTRWQARIVDKGLQPSLVMSGEASPETDTTKEQSTRAPRTGEEFRKLVKGCRAVQMEDIRLTPLETRA